MQKDLPFYKNIVQIEFNAWNYSGGNLWAALVQHILENLRLSDEDDKDIVAKRVDHLKKQMQLETEVREVAVTRQKEAQEQVRGFTKELCKLRERHDQEITRLKEVLAEDVLKTVQLDSESVDQLNKVRSELGLSDVAANAGEFLAALEGASKLLTRVSALVAYVPESQRSRFRLNSALVLLGPPCVAAVIGVAIHWLDPYVASISAAAGWISASLALGTQWLRGRMKDLDKPLAQLERNRTEGVQEVVAAAD